MTRETMKKILLTQLQEENPSLFRRLVRVERELEAFLNIQEKACRDALKWGTASGLRPDECRELGIAALLDYPEKPLDQTDPSLVDRDYALPSSAEMLLIFS